MRKIKKRKIKFRIWNGNDFVTTRTKIGYWGKSGYKERDLNDVIPDYCTLQQFTGLHDKNGAEIYEGDILSSKVFFYKVVFMEGSFMAMALDNQSGATLCETVISHWELELTGNIFENPELLAPNDKVEGGEE